MGSTQEPFFRLLEDCGYHNAAICGIWRNCHVGNKKSTRIHSIYAILASLTWPQESDPVPGWRTLVTPYISRMAFLHKYMILILSMGCQQSVGGLGGEVVFRPIYSWDPPYDPKRDKHCSSGLTSFQYFPTISRHVFIHTHFIKCY